ncbi:MAG: metal-dependent transcriptional regulator [Cyclobacteriaceae bacterium]|jgi:DtxR family Mn-dependent transcriptional regulator|nr:metal-dependent transcriptional regulator [Flammeovirgaceae bacterium]
MLSLAEENYLKAIYHLSLGGQAVLTNDLAAQLHTKAASVTDMIKRLSLKALVRHEKYYGVTLTKKGTQAALSIVRKHRLWETFLVQKLGFTWDEVHEVAEQLEHIQSARLIEALDEFLGYPSVDPHGDPIPDKTGKMTTSADRALSEMSPGFQGRIQAVKDSDSQLLKYLDKLGAHPGTPIQLVAIETFDGSLEVIIRKTRYFLSREVSQNILVTHP